MRITEQALTEESIQIIQLNDTYLISSGKERQNTINRIANKYLDLIDATRNFESFERDEQIQLIEIIGNRALESLNRTAEKTRLLARLEREDLEREEDSLLCKKLTVVCFPFVVGIFTGPTGFIAALAIEGAVLARKCLTAPQEPESDTDSE